MAPGMMNLTYLRALANTGNVLLTHVGLVDEHGQELSGAPYTRQSASWIVRPDGNLGLALDLKFRIPAGSTIAGWRGYDEAEGGTDYGGPSLTQESFAGPGLYTLLAQGTSVNHQAR
jgi:hypothetical protein